MNRHTVRKAGALVGAATLAAGVALVPPMGSSTAQAEEGSPPEATLRRVLTTEHVDAINVVLEGQELAVNTKVSPPVEYFDTDDLIYHLSDAGLVEGLPAQYVEFIGADSAWVIPQTQNPEVIWAGWSTEGIAAGQLDGDVVDITLADVRGPGEVEVWQTVGFGEISRIFSSDEDHKTLTQSVNAHVHASWAFTQPGVYTVTFVASASVAGQPVESQPMEYTWVVGGESGVLPEPVASTTVLDAPTSVDPGDEVWLTASVAMGDAGHGAPPSPGGYVEFSHGDVSLGWADIAEGEATLMTSFEAPGEYEVTATYTTQEPQFYAGSVSEPVTIDVGDGSGDVSGGDVSGGDVSGGDVSGGDVSGGDVSGGDVSGGDVSGGDVSGGDVSGGDESGGDVSGGDVSGGDVSGGDVSGGDESGGDVSGGDESGGDVSGTDDGTGPKPTTKPTNDVCPPGKVPAGTQPSTGPSDDGSARGNADDNGQDGDEGQGDGSENGSETGGENGGPGEPPSGEQVVLTNEHVDLLSPRLNGSNLALQAKVGSANDHTFHDPDGVLVQVKPEAETTVPSGDGYGFLGSPGDPIWLIPETQNQEIVWAGWSTEQLEPGDFHGDAVEMRMVDVEGPGTVEVFQTTGFGDVSRIFSSTDSLDARRQSVGQHVHANWAFSAEGEYTVTFEVSGTLAGGESVTTGPVDYSFTVGELSGTNAVSSSGASSAMISPALYAGSGPATVSAATQMLPDTGAADKEDCVLASTGSSGVNGTVVIGGVLVLLGGAAAAYAYRRRGITLT